MKELRVKYLVAIGAFFCFDLVFVINPVYWWEIGAYLFFMAVFGYMIGGILGMKSRETNRVEVNLFRLIFTIATCILIAVVTVMAGYFLCIQAKDILLIAINALTALCLILMVFNDKRMVDSGNIR